MGLHVHTYLPHLDYSNCITIVPKPCADGIILHG